MREAQHEFDAKATPLCPAHLTAPVLHRVLAHPPLEQHVWGGKGVGSQAGGGFVQASRLPCASEHHIICCADEEVVRCGLASHAG